MNDSTVQYGYLISVIFIFLFDFSGAPFTCFDASQYGNFFYSDSYIY